MIGSVRVGDWIAEIAEIRVVPSGFEIETVGAYTRSVPESAPYELLTPDGQLVYAGTEFCALPQESHAVLTIHLSVAALLTPGGDSLSLRR